MIAANDPAYLYDLTGKITFGTDMIIEGSAHNWIDTLKEFLVVHPDVSLIEFRMPGVSQVELMKKAYPDSRIILLSGPSEADANFRKVIAQGVDGVVSKKASRERLLQSIRTVFNGGSCLPRWASGISASRQ